MPYPILTVDPDVPLDDEALGSKPKFWFRHDDRLWLFKEARENTGEDWAEKIAAEIAALLVIPAAKVELADYQRRRGCASLSFVDPHRGQELIHGNEILAGQVLGYDREKRFRQSDHTLANIYKAIGKLFTKEEDRQHALTVLASYMILDALVGNTDRHHENWGLLLHSESHGSELFGYALSVAPSFDHASSLGRELRDERRGRYLKENRVADYVRKGRGGIFIKPTDKRGANPLQLVEINGRSRKYRLYFAPALERLRATSLAVIHDVVDRVPPERMSDSARAFSKAMLSYTYGALCKLTG